MIACAIKNEAVLIGICLCLSVPMFAQLSGDTGNAEPLLSAQLVQDPVLLNPNTINELLAVDARQARGMKQFGPQGKLNAKRFWLTGFDREKKIEWNVFAPTSGAYYIEFLVNCHSGTQIIINGPTNNMTFSSKAHGWQRASGEDSLWLPAGSSTIALSLISNDTIGIKSIELIYSKAKKNIDERIKNFKGDAGWMKDAGYGIMTQVGGWAYPAKGPKKAWPGFAEDFDVVSFVDKIRDMGGKYLVWSATWSDYLFPAPIKAIAAVLPQRVSKRDLIGDLIKECSKYDIKVMLYYHLGHDHKDVLLAKGWRDTTIESFESRQKWLDLETDIFKEIGIRYGKGLHAIFLDDGCVWYPADFEKLGAALKTGNRDRLICYNPWIAPSLTPFQDFYCGEGFDGRDTPYTINNGFITEGPQKGLQLFGNFIFDGPDWGINQPNIVISAPVHWTSDKVIDMTRKLEKERYSVAINLLVYEDGSIGKASYEILKEAAQKMKRGKWAVKQQ